MPRPFATLILILSLVGALVIIALTTSGTLETALAVAIVPIFTAFGLPLVMGGVRRKRHIEDRPVLDEHMFARY